MKLKLKSVFAILGSLYLIACGITWVVRQSANSAAGTTLGQTVSANAMSASPANATQATAPAGKSKTADQDGWHRADKNSPIDGVVYQAAYEGNGNVHGQTLQTLISCNPGKKELSVSLSSLLDDPAYQGFLSNRIYGVTTPDGRVKTRSGITDTTWLVAQTQYNNSAELDLKLLVQSDIVSLLKQKGLMSGETLTVLGYLEGKEREIFLNYVDTHGIIEFVEQKLPVVVELNDATGKVYFTIPKGNQVIDDVLDQCRMREARAIMRSTATSNTDRSRVAPTSAPSAIAAETPATGQSAPISDFLTAELVKEAASRVKAGQYASLDVEASRIGDAVYKLRENVSYRALDADQLLTAFRTCFRKQGGMDGIDVIRMSHENNDPNARYDTASQYSFAHPDSILLDSRLEACSSNALATNPDAFMGKWKPE